MRFGFAPDKPPPFLTIRREKLGLAMVFVVGKRLFDDGMPAFGIFLLAAITADDEMIGGARHGHIK